MSRGRKTKTADAPPTGGVSAGDPQPDYALTTGGEFKGKVRDVEVGAITGDVSQTNQGGSAGLNLAGANGGTTTQDVGIGLTQSNDLSVVGEASLSFDFREGFKGQIRDVEVGLLTGDVTQSNTAGQLGVNGAAGNRGGTTQQIDQVAVQSNVIDIEGSVALSVVAKGDFKGKLRDIEVGLATGDIVQSNDLTQIAGNIAFKNAGGTAQRISQDALQKNLVTVLGDVKVSIVFEGEFKGQFRDVTIGVMTADIQQSNQSLSVGLNVAAANGGSVKQDILQSITQTSWVDAQNDLCVEIRIKDGIKDNIRGLDFDIVVDNVLHAPSDAIW